MLLAKFMKVAGSIFQFKSNGGKTLFKSEFNIMYGKFKVDIMFLRLLLNYARIF